MNLKKGLKRIHKFVIITTIFIALVHIMSSYLSYCFEEKNSYERAIYRNIGAKNIYNKVSKASVSTNFHLVDVVVNSNTNITEISISSLYRFEKRRSFQSEVDIVMIDYEKLRTIADKLYINDSLDPFSDFRSKVNSENEDIYRFVSSYNERVNCEKVINDYGGFFYPDRYTFDFDNFLWLVPNYALFILAPIIFVPYILFFFYKFVLLKAFHFFKDGFKDE